MGVKRLKYLQNCREKVVVVVLTLFLKDRCECREVSVPRKKLSHRLPPIKPQPVVFTLKFLYGFNKPTILISDHLRCLWADFDIEPD